MGIAIGRTEQHQYPMPHPWGPDTRSAPKARTDTQRKGRRHDLSGG
ncbi:hypothetical protein GZL_08198 [Streptomyces sp. 769]|nr:hypothetical protein GZL_08198 [Streptomyces sp. 769]